MIPGIYIPDYPIITLGVSCYDRLGSMNPGQWDSRVPCYIIGIVQCKTWPRSMSPYSATMPQWVNRLDCSTVSHKEDIPSMCPKAWNQLHLITHIQCFITNQFFYSSSPWNLNSDSWQFIWYFPRPHNCYSSLSSYPMNICLQPAVFPTKHDR